MFCTKCGRENKDDASFCIQCGAGLVQKTTVEIKEKPSKTKKTFYTCGIIAAVLVILAIVIPIGICAIIGIGQNQESKALKINNSLMTTDILGYSTVTGTVTNTGNSEISIHGITAKFYNSQDVVIYTGSDYVENIGSGEKAQFSITCLEQGAVRYEVSVD